MMDILIWGVPLDSLLVAFVGGFILATAYRFLGISRETHLRDGLLTGLSKAALIWILYPFAQTLLRAQHTNSLHEMWIVSVIYWTVVLGFILSAVIHIRRAEHGDTLG
jgi:hypothetical protein